MEDPAGWFTSNLTVPRTTRTVEVDGAAINYLEWGRDDHPGLIFVHGGAAHAHWWSFIAPFFAESWHVGALDLSGHGDSGRREEYSRDQWSREIMGVCDDLGFPGPPVVVGHSLGGLITIHAAATVGDLLAGAVIVDAPVRRPDPESEEGARGRSFRSPGVYPTLQEALTHFRLVPPQPINQSFIIDHIARHSLHETPDGWTWKFDPRIFDHARFSLRKELTTVKCRVALLRGELSQTVPPDTADYMYDLMGRRAPVASIPQAYHHLILDQPLAFVAALRTLLADWVHSIPPERHSR